MKSRRTKIVTSIFTVLVLSISSISNTLAQDNLIIKFSGMTPHINQTLYIRVVDKSTMREAGRTSQQVTTPGFSITLPAIESAKSYFVDFFADFNSNSRYDAPPVDHAWRLELNNAKAGGDTLNFSHNASFTDIKWPYVLTVNFTSMTPHVGQLLELRVENNNTNEEVGRIKVLAVPSPDFQIQIVGLQLNTEYKVQFYADLNNNGIYNIPPTDHAWEITFTNTTGDAIVDFSHNTTFTDINWKYLLTVNLTLMTPHLGDLFQLRVVRQDNQVEIGRFTLLQVLVPDFSVFIPEFELGHNYYIDFYADYSGNGLYDVPPIDHAWRLSFISNTGDFVQNFTHNTSFTDIQWPNITGVSEEEGLTPNTYSLEQNFPNPFNPSTTINFSIPQKDFVNLKIYNLVGEELKTLLNEEKDAGTYQIKFDALNLPTGIYFYKLNTSSFSETKKMILLK
jgi:hypothetical protein